MGKLHAWMSKLHSTCTKEQFEKNLMLVKKVYCFCHFWIVIKICSEFLQKKFGTVVRTAFHVKRWSFQERTNLSNKTEVLTFLGIGASNLRSWVKASCTVVKTEFYIYEGTLREKIGNGEKRLLFLSLLKFNQNMFGVLAEKFRHGVQNCLSRLQMILPRKKNKSLE